MRQGPLTGGQRGCRQGRAGRGRQAATQQPGGSRSPAVKRASPRTLRVLQAASMRCLTPSSAASWATTAAACPRPASSTCCSAAAAAARRPATSSCVGGQADRQRSQRQRHLTGVAHKRCWLTWWRLHTRAPPHPRHTHTRTHLDAQQLPGGGGDALLGAGGVVLQVERHVLARQVQPHLQLGQKPAAARQGAARRRRRIAGSSRRQAVARRRLREHSWDDITAPSMPSASNEHTHTRRRSSGSRRTAPAAARFHDWHRTLC